MGDRGEVVIAGVHLYTHWHAEDLPNLVQAALARAPDRWDNPEYLARVLLCEMIGAAAGDPGLGFLGTQGYGISCTPFDAWRRVEVIPVSDACPAGAVRILEQPHRVGDPFLPVYEAPLEAYATAGMPPDACPCCRARFDMAVQAHWNEDGTPAGYRCPTCRRNYLHGPDGRTYTQGPTGEAEEVLPDGTLIPHEAAAQERGR